MKNSPQTESEYFELLERIVKGAEYLDNPLITEADFAKGAKLYDELVELAQEYQRNERKEKAA